MRRTVNFFIVALCVAVPAMAQDFQQAPQGPPAQPARVAAPTPMPTPGQRMAPTMAPPQGGQRVAVPTPQAASAPVAPQRQVDPRIDQSDVNIKLIVKITDTSASGTQTKIVSLIMANKGSGRVRSQGSTTTPNNTKNSELNVDARTTLLKSGAISTNMTITYTPEWTEEATKFTGVSQSVDLFLKDGVATVVTQAADPTKGTRSVTIEATASVVK